MKLLYEIPRGSKIFCNCTDGSKYIIFNHLDGMYSHCKTEKGEVVHLRGNAPLRKVKGGYKLSTEKE